MNDVTIMIHKETDLNIFVRMKVKKQDETRKIYGKFEGKQQRR